MGRLEDMKKGKKSVAKGNISRPGSKRMGVEPSPFKDVKKRMGVEPSPFKNIKNKPGINPPASSH